MSQSSSAPLDNQNDDWRSSVAQSTRSAEVRAVADVLAKMEHGATASSKLMLAMRFEDEIFNKATSLKDYQKRIQKRLKKVTKNYKATAPSPLPANTKERLQELKRMYGERLRYICDNADAAIDVFLKKNKEPEKAKTLKQHTDNAKQWAINLGVLPGTSLNTGMDAKGIEEMANLLERRVDNIRNHVMKLASMDLLLQETLEKLEQNLTDNASQLLATATSSRLARLHWNDFDNPIKALQDNLQKAQAPIAPPTRSKESQRNVALLQLERMRNAAQAVLAFLAVSNKHSSSMPQEVLSKCYAAAMQALEYIAQVMPQLVDPKVKEEENTVSLEDAWTKVMEYPTDNDLSSSSSSLDQAQQQKRRKLDNATTTPLAIRSRVLLTPGRKTQSNLLAELKRKGARLVRPPPNGQGSYLVVKFGNAFCMTIYFVPLLVTIRALTTTSDGNDNGDTSDDVDEDGCACWTPVQAGLENRDELTIWNTTGSPSTLGHVVQAQLDYASTRATLILRKLFSTSTQSGASDFEVEISEGTALLQFLQLARTTYTPNFKEAELF